MKTALTILTAVVCLANPLQFQRITASPPAEKQTPVEVNLESFVLTSTPSGVDIEWTTSREVKNYSFTAEVLIGEDWEHVATVPGAGNSNNLNSYLVHNEGPGLTYRLSDDAGNIVIEDTLDV